MLQRTKVFYIGASGVLVVCNLHENCYPYGTEVVVCDITVALHCLYSWLCEEDDDKSERLGYKSSVGWSNMVFGDRLIYG